MSPTLRYYDDDEAGDNTAVLGSESPGQVAQFRALQQAIESEVISLSLENDELSGPLPVVALKSDIRDLDTAFQILSSNPRFQSSAAVDQDPLGEGPPPRYFFRVLDRDRIDSLEGLAASDIPVVIADILLYGRQTDRESRAVLIAAKGKQFAAALELVRESLNETLLGEFTEEQIAVTSVAESTLVWSWQVPPDATTRQYRNLIAQQKRVALLEEWPHIEYRCLGGQTPMDASQDPERSLSVEALVSILEQSPALDLSDDQLISDLRKLLHLDPPEILDARSIDVDLLTPLGMRRLDPATLDDESILKVFVDALSINNTGVLRNTILEILERSELADAVPRHFCYSILASMADDDEDSVEYLNLARQEVKKSGGNVGQFLVEELEIRLSRGMTEKLPELVDSIRRNHMHEPNVEVQLARTLGKFGLISPDGKTVSLPVSRESRTAKKEPAIWTPDAEAAADPADRTQASKIWVPGDD